MHLIFLQVLEHPQNVFYTRVIQASIALKNATGGRVAEDGTVIKPSFKRTTNLALNLQNSVNALLDSSTGKVLMTVMD
jgi:hypothetical protein